MKRLNCITEIKKRHIITLAVGLVCLSGITALTMGNASAEKNSPLIQTPVLPDNVGVNIHFYDNEPGMDALKSLSAKWLRMDFSWNGIEKQKGFYDFREIDKLMNDAKARGFKVLAILDYGNSLYGPENNGKITSDEARAAFARYAVALAKRYADRKVIWEIWNEPNNGGFWPGNDPAEYIQLVKVTSRAVRQAAPGAVLAGPSTYTVAEKYMEECLKLGLMDYVDAVSFHPYQRERPKNLVEDMANLRALITKYLKPGEKQPAVICSEWGFSATHHSVEGQAERVPRAMFLSMLERMPVYIYYDLWNDGSSTTNSEHHYGLFTSPPYLVPKPAALTYMSALKVMKGYRFNQRLVLLDDSKDHFVLEFVKSDNPNDKRYVHWSSRIDKAPIGWTLPKSMGPLYKIDQYGQVISGTFLPGDQMTSRNQVEYLCPAAKVKGDWAVMAKRLPDNIQDNVPWQADINLRGPGQSEAVNPEKGRRINTGFQDLDAGSVDVWINPTSKDFGKSFVIGGDIDKPYLTLNLALDATGNVSGSHWAWNGQQWVTPLSTNQPVTLGRWTRITYQWGDMGQRLYVDGMPVAANPLETRGIAFSFHVEACKLDGNTGLLQLIKGTGFLP